MAQEVQGVRGRTLTGRQNSPRKQPIVRFACAAGLLVAVGGKPGVCRGTGGTVIVPNMEQPGGAEPAAAAPESSQSKLRLIRVKRKRGSEAPEDLGGF